MVTVLWKAVSQVTQDGAVLMAGMRVMGREPGASSQLQVTSEGNGRQALEGWNKYLQSQGVFRRSHLTSYCVCRITDDNDDYLN